MDRTYGNASAFALGDVFVMVRRGSVVGQNVAVEFRQIGTSARDVGRLRGHRRASPDAARRPCVALGRCRVQAGRQANRFHRQLLAPNR
jgi:hypothetical protein